MWKVFPSRRRPSPISCFSDFGHAPDLAAGDKDLAAGDPAQHERLPPRVQLGKHVVQQQHRPFARLLKKNLPAGQFQRQRRRAGLSLRGKGLGAFPVDLHVQIVLMGAGKALPGLQFGLPVPLLMLQQLGQDLPRGGLRIGHGLHRLIMQLQPLPASGKIQMDGGRDLPQALDEVGPVMDEHRPRLGHAEVEFVQRVQQGGLFRTVPEDAGLVLIKPAVLGQGLGIPGAQLADAAVQKPPAHQGPLPDQVQILRAKQNGVQHPRQLPGGLEAHAVGEQLPPPGERRASSVKSRCRALTWACTKAWSTPNWINSRSYRARWEDAVDKYATASSRLVFPWAFSP